MAAKLTLKGAGLKWYPNTIGELNRYLGHHIRSNDYYSGKEANALKKNLSYSLQYIEFLEQVLIDINLSSVLWTQNVKSFVIHGASVIEAIFNYTIISAGYSAEEQWESVKKFRSNEYGLGGETLVQDTEIFKKVSPPYLAQMTFDQLCKKVESRKLLGEARPLYTNVAKIRKLRNKVHIHDVSTASDSDWWLFNDTEYELMKKTLYGVLASKLFDGASKPEMFNFLSVELADTPS